MRTGPESVVPLYCTWSFRDQLSPTLHKRLRDLDHFLRELIVSARSSILIVTPYLSPVGVVSLRSALAVSAQNGAWIKLVTSDVQNREGQNKRAIQELVDGEEGKLIIQRIRILSDTRTEPIFFHSKVVVVDGERGYLGSANLSWSGLSNNFEIGTALAPSQAETLDNLFSSFEADGLLTDCSKTVLRD